MMFDSGESTILDWAKHKLVGSLVSLKRGKRG